MYLLHRISVNRYMFHVEDVRMNWQTSAKLVALTSVMTAMSFSAPSVTAQSKDLERTLAGVRLNASSRTVLSKFGNPNEIYIGGKPGAKIFEKGKAPYESGEGVLVFERSSL